MQKYNGIVIFNDGKAAKYRNVTNPQKLMQWCVNQGKKVSHVNLYFATTTESHKKGEHYKQIKFGV